MSGSMMFTSSCKGKDTVCNCIEAVEGVWISSCVSCVYHVWEYDVHKLMQLEELIDIFLSHDWLLGTLIMGTGNNLFATKTFQR
ncbi:hypothetical protein ES332_A11G000500v1 [Gossypium tomentosum]|uniref:Uncharacterized protein n=1 Tax=Gossypium tomentosum TaxID=34277 RepID=A0A5D2N3N6_GOSTO|nr:hypothetical protein ES332_A11G000500v1 [Gossypium tomentosum]